MAVHDVRVELDDLSHSVWTLESGIEFEENLRLDWDYCRKLRNMRLHCGNLDNCEDKQAISPVGVVHVETELHGTG